MRLPTITPQQTKIENARAIHEQLWAACEAQEKLTLLGGGLACKRLHDALKRYWLERGYRLRTKLVADKSAFQAWVEPLEAHD